MFNRGSLPNRPLLRGSSQATKFKIGIQSRALLRSFIFFLRQMFLMRLGLHLKARDLGGGPRSGSTGGWRRLEAVAVSYKCH